MASMEFGCVDRLKGFRLEVLEWGLEFGLKALGLRSLGCRVCCCPPRW